MLPTRRSVLALPGLLAASLAFGVDPPARAADADPRLGERALGSASAKVVTEEWFSLTCIHCARFAAEVYPKVKSQLIDTGKLRYVFKDFPLDQVALTAAMVARALPAAEYEPFVLNLLATQERWAGPDADTNAELARMAGEAGMPKALFDATIKDTRLRDAILAEQARGEKAYGINSTPTFVIDGKPHVGEMSYSAFAALVGA